MLRAAVITGNFPQREQPHRGHSTYQTLRILSRWMQIQVFCPTPVYPSWWKPRKFQFPKCDDTYAPSGVAVRYLKYHALPGISRPFNGFAAALAAFPHVQRFRPDLILNYVIYPDGFASILVGKKLQVPVVLGAIGSDLHSIPDRATRWLTRWALKEASFVSTVSDDLRNRAIAFGAQAEVTRAILNGVDTSVFRVMDRTVARRALGLDPHCPLILFVGWLAAHKGVQELMQAFTNLRTSYCGLKLAFVGEGVLKRKMEACSAGFAQNILFPGPCSSQEVSVWMAAADVVCLPTYAEGCPNVILEALACGRPIVASAVGGIPEIINDRSAILIPPRNIERLTEALAVALEKDWDARAISQQSQRSWQQVAAELFDTCKLVAGSNRGKSFYIQSSQGDCLWH